MNCPKCGEELTQFTTPSNPDGSKPWGYIWVCENCREKFIGTKEAE